MTKDFYDHMKEEKELLNLSYRESLRQKEERMAVWDPQDKMPVLSQIKKAIKHPVSGFKPWRGMIGPGILIILTLFLLIGCASVNWPWEKKESRQVDPLTVPSREFICTKIDCGDEDIEKLIEEEQNTIACIKLEPACKLEEEK